MNQSIKLENIPEIELDAILGKEYTRAEIADNTYKQARQNIFLIHQEKERREEVNTTPDKELKEVKEELKEELKEVKEEIKEVKEEIKE